jgi:hypothetical protein
MGGSLKAVGGKSEWIVAHSYEAKIDPQRPSDFGIGRNVPGDHEIASMVWLRASQIRTSRAFGPFMMPNFRSSANGGPIAAGAALSE